MTAETWCLVKMVMGMGGLTKGQVAALIAARCRRCGGLTCGAVCDTLSDTYDNRIARGSAADPIFQVTCPN